MWWSYKWSSAVRKDNRCEQNVDACLTAEKLESARKLSLDVSSI